MYWSEKPEMSDRYRPIPQKFERPDLETLLQDVKELGYVGAGKKYGITDNGLRKWIKSYQEKVEQVE